ncbi:related to dimeric dihydrodiol dehydrogenase [Ramularia collo-cygni]|uniref:D-xylose 1-dehydrogenase (NADP(+), D-xylono-1,5-lactone-forming) n=1 Tax=Ramularia collo-cygni TaxID=112498 RepID=A0A2D3UQ80_9PEZI|nr:related to dimeric dihydrodiol dehydrogenase [Ramularia collo-cygni]CZT16328.1 related to dimeric dihydrodiol dehydrogenase [Ramularia collo-cygni]
MSKYQVKWGILATGGIAESFARDLWVNPETRDVKDIEHVVVAAASSSSSDRAAAFLKEVRAPESAKAYGSYKELVEDPNVDIIYVATPHSHHYQNARLALEAGKNVLCEKAFTTNAAQLEVLIKIAKEKNLFLMEAVWTRYFPLSIYVRDIITSGKIGTVLRTSADLSIGAGSDSFGDEHRMVNLNLAGGALLDLGIYALTWVFQTLYHTQKSPQAPKVSSTMQKYKTGADEQTSILLKFPREGLPDAHGIATTSMNVAGDPDKKASAGPAMRIQGTKGEIQVFHPAYRPTKTKLVLVDGTVEDKTFTIPGPGKGSGWKNGFGGDWQPEGEGQGMFWEADEAAFALRDGRKEGQYESLEESLTIMRVMDEVRKQNDLVYPHKIETTQYPVDL